MRKTFILLLPDEAKNLRARAMEKKKEHNCQEVGVTGTKHTGGVSDRRTACWDGCKLSSGLHFDGHTAVSVSFISFFLKYLQQR